MKNSRTRSLGWGIKGLLILTGMIAVSIGSALLFIPVAFEASAGIQLGRDANLLSEIRAPGGALAVAGCVIAAGAWVPKLSMASLWTASLLYLSYGLSRWLGYALDEGLSSTMVSVATIETVIGTLCAIALAARSLATQPRPGNQPVDQSCSV